jgi:carbon-monoxide dehydrogenase iron sulfur subunit
MTCPYGVIGRQAGVRKAVKCDRCKDLDEPACVHACPTRSLVFATQSEFMEMMRKEAGQSLNIGEKEQMKLRPWGSD